MSCDLLGPASRNLVPDVFSVEIINKTFCVFSNETLHNQTSLQFLKVSWKLFVMAWTCHARKLSGFLLAPEVAEVRGERPRQSRARLLVGPSLPGLDNLENRQHNTTLTVPRVIHSQDNQNGGPGLPCQDGEQQHHQFSFLRTI